MTGRVAIAALALSTPAAADVPGRLGASVSMGGGWASDVFVGAGAGDNGFAQVIPAARLDLGLAPAWKLAALGEVFYGTYRPSGFTTLSESGTLEARWLPAEDWEVSVSGTAEHADFSQGAPLDPDLVASPTITAATGWRVSPGARLRAAGWEWRASVVAAGRNSRAEGQPVHEQVTSLVAGARRPLDPRFDLTLSGRLTRSDSAREDFAFDAAAILVAVGARVLEDTRLEALAQVQGSRFDTASRETLVRLTLSATHPLWEKVDLEVAWSYAGNASNDPARSFASRQVVFLGLVGRSGYLSW